MGSLWLAWLGTSIVAPPGPGAHRGPDHDDLAGRVRSGRFRHRDVEPQQALRVAGQDLPAFGWRARQAIDELPGEGGSSVRVVGTEQEAARAKLGVAVLQRPGPVAEGGDVELVRVHAV